MWPRPCSEKFRLKPEAALAEQADPTGRRPNGLAPCDGLQGEVMARRVRADIGEGRGLARRGGFMRLAACGLLAGILALVGCATAQAPGMPAQAAFGPGGPPAMDPYKVGPITVWLRPQPEVEFLCRLRLANVSRDRQVMGCYLPDTHTIIAVADAQVLLHEFKHHFEGKFHE